LASSTDHSVSSQRSTVAPSRPASSTASSAPKAALPACSAASSPEAT
jgi:hypothetical protein